MPELAPMQIPCVALVNPLRPQNNGKRSEPVDGSLELRGVRKYMSTVRLYCLQRFLSLETGQ